MRNLAYGRALFIGRFQPFHLGHLYLLRVMLKDFRRLVIGVGSSQFSNESRNPFSFSERREMIGQALKAEGFERWRVIAIPDIREDSLWVGHVQSLVPPFDVVYSHDPLTCRLFQEAGLVVESPPLFDKGMYSGTEVRRRMVEGENWEELVPAPVATYLRTIDAVERVKTIESVEG